MENTTPSSDDDSTPGPSIRKNKRKVTHVKKACDRCRRRKIRCNGQQPCEICMEKEISCIYENEDKRRTRSELEDVKDRLNRLERLLEAQSRPSSEDQTSVHQSQPALPPLNESIDTAVTNHNMNVFDFPPISNDYSSSAVVNPSTSSIRNNHITSGSHRYPDLALPSTHLDRLKPTSKDGPPVQYGATSIWTHDTYEKHTFTTQDTRRTDLLPGEWLDWGRNLPTTLMTVLTKSVHDQAINHFAAYYASWCIVVDMEAFKRDLIVCNISSINSQQPSSPKWTPHYSPFLHNVVLWSGLFYNKEAWPEVYYNLTECFVEHCTKLMKTEFDRPPLSALRAVNLYGTCLAQPPMGSHDYGYTYYGMAVAMIQVLGLNINCEAYIAQGRMSQSELELRHSAYWAVYLYDLLRSISAGRPPMVATPQPDIPLPAVVDEIDNTLWYSSTSAMGQDIKLGHTLNGMKSMKSTVFHWTARLGRLLSRVVDTLYSSKKEELHREDVIDEIVTDLDKWYIEQPFADPNLLPLPHIILLHVTYHLTRIFLFRPFYRTSGMRTDFLPSEHCNNAAKAILDLLKLYDQYHGLRYGAGTFLNATFTSATIFLLKAVENQGDSSDLPGSSCDSSKDIKEILSTYYMSQLAITFGEASRGLNILQSLCSEWLPTLNSNTEDSISITQLQSNNDILPFDFLDTQAANGGNGMTSMGYQNFLTDFPMDDNLYNALLSFVGGT